MWVFCQQQPNLNLTNAEFGTWIVVLTVTEPKLKEAIALKKMKRKFQNVGIH